MAFKTDNYKIMGMKQDLSESAFDKKFSYENLNIRIDNRSNGTLLSVENERGNKQIIGILLYDDLEYIIQSTPLSLTEIPFIVTGKCVIGKYIVLFGVSEDGTRDYILRIENIGTQWKAVYLFNSTTLHLNFDKKYPIECLGIVETENIIKIFWVDGKNASRFINILDPNSINASHLYGTQPILRLEESLLITKNFNVPGQFKGGKIQYAFTYYNDVQQETNVVEVSELFDCTFKNNALAADDATNYADHSFNVKITNIDPSFKYLKIYRLFYGSLHGLPTITSLPVVYINYGSVTEYSILDLNTDYNEESNDLRTSMMQSFIPYTLSAKDNTLFYGNIKYELPNIKDISFDDANLSPYIKTIGKEELSQSDVYQYDPIKTTYKGGNRSYKGFKKYNWYKFGFVCQHISGEWSDVIYLTDKQCLLRSVSTKKSYDNSVTLGIPNFEFRFNNPNDITTLMTLYNMGYRKIKPVCVLPSEIERVVVSQGVLNPTVYLGSDRINCLNGQTAPFAKASWFFRPTLAKNPLTYNNSLNLIKINYPYTIRNLSTINSDFEFNPSYREYRHEFGLPPKDRINAELESSDCIINAYYVDTSTSISLYKMYETGGELASHRVSFCNQPVGTTYWDFEADRISIDAYNFTLTMQDELSVNPIGIATNCFIDKDTTYYPTGYGYTYYVDESIFTFNSPEVDFCEVIDYVSLSSFNSFDLYLDVCGSSQITGSFFDKYIPDKRSDQSTYFDDSIVGRCLFNITYSENNDIEDVKNLIRKRPGVSGYNIPISGPWWFEWILVLGFTHGAYDTITDSVDDIYNPAGMKEHNAIDLKNHALTAISGKQGWHLLQSFYGVLRCRPSVDYWHLNAVDHYNLIYLKNGEPIETNKEHVLATIPFSLPSNPYYPNDTSVANIDTLRAIWAGYGIVSYRPEYHDFVNQNEETAFEQNAIGDNTISGFYPAKKSGSVLDTTGILDYGCHYYHPRETIFTHNAFDSYYPHIIFPFMGEDTSVMFNGNCSRYSSIGSNRRPEQNITCNLLYSKLTKYNTKINENSVLLKNVDLGYFGKEDDILGISGDFGWCTEYKATAQFYQGTSTGSNLKIPYRTKHLLPALKWYRGFNSLKLPTTLVGQQLVTNYLTTDVFKENIFCSGHLPQIFRKHGSIFNITLEPNDMSGGVTNADLYYRYVITSGAVNEYTSFPLAQYMPTQRYLSVLYKSTPHIFSSFKTLNNKRVLLPEINVDSISTYSFDYTTNNQPKLVAEYYLKEFSRHTNHTTGLSASLDVSKRLDQSDYIVTFLENSLYPFSGIWSKTINDREMNVNLYNGDYATFWESINSKRFDCYKEKITLDGNELFLNESNTGNVINGESMGFLHIGEYINTTNFSPTISPFKLNKDAYLWLPAGDSYNILALYNRLMDPIVKPGGIRFTEGDIYFQRYNCLKTTPFNPDDEKANKNAIVELASVFIETYINLDGRTDQTDFYDNRHDFLKYKKEKYSEEINTAHSKPDDYFTYRQVDYTYIISALKHYPTRILWSGVKVYGDMIDNWCFVPSINKYDADGVCGEINALRFLNNNIYCLQKNGVSIIDYNAKAALSGDTGDQVILASSLNMSGLNYISKSIGTSNKFSTVVSKYGLYFIDETMKELFSISSNGIESISTNHGMSTWFHKQLVEYEKWEADLFMTTNISDKKTFVGYTDSLYDDIYFTNQYYTIVFNEKLKTFTSFYSYEKTPYMFNYMNKFYALYYKRYPIGGGNTEELTGLWAQHEGNYYSIYDNLSIKFNITLLSNPDYMYDKIYNFIEFQEDCYIKDGTEYNKYAPNKTSIISLECNNEYQISQSISTVTQRFNIWRMDVGRDVLNNRDRMRGAWCKLSLTGKMTAFPPKDMRMKLQYINVNYSFPTQPPKEL